MAIKRIDAMTTKIKERVDLERKKQDIKNNKWYNKLFRNIAEI